MHNGNGLMTENLQNVPRETFNKWTVYVDLLAKWQKSINLVSQGTQDLWGRHIEDSWQLASHIEGADKKSIVDIGSGGGLPAIVLACGFAEKSFTLIESDKRKTIFLEQVKRELGLDNVSIVNCRVEQWAGRGDIITSRALAELDELLVLSSRIMTENAFCLFLKGRKWDMEITKAKKSWSFHYEALQSMTEPQARILKIDKINRITH